MFQSGIARSGWSFGRAVKAFNLMRSQGHRGTQVRTWLTLGVFTAGVVLTCASALYVKAELESTARRDFVFSCNEIKNKLSTRLRAHAQLLHSAASLFEVSGTITRERWHDAIARQKIESNLPGIQGIGFALIIPSGQLTRHEQTIRNEGFPLYAVRPSGMRAVYTAIIYLEPFSGRNLRAFGYDMFSEPVRRRAMEHARDFDEAALSGKVTLVQESDSAQQAGTLMYVPVYERGQPVGTMEDRRKAIRGWAYSPYRMNDLMQGILGGWEHGEGRQIRMEVFDDTSYSPGASLYDSRPELSNGAASAALFREETSIDFNTRTWRLRFSKAGELTGNIDYSEVWYVLSGGAAVSILLSVLYLLLGITRDSEDRYSLTLEAVNDGLWDWNVVSGEAFFSPQYYSMLGYGNGEFQASYAAWRDLVHREDLDRVEAQLQRSIANGEGFAIDLRMMSRSDGWQWVSTRGRVVEWDAETKAMRIVGTLSDITNRKAAEERIQQLLAEKELILKEVHHRIKNNMSTVMSMLSLQTHVVRDPCSVAALQDATRRIQSMMVLYDRLYRSANFRELSIKEYLVPLIQEIVSNCPLKENISVDTLVDDGILHAGILSSVGIIINELVTNAMKHAFTGRAGGSLVITASLEEHRLALVVQDDGVGLPALFDLNTSTGFGLQLVRSLIAQLDGTLRIEREGGTRFVVECVV